MSAWGSNSPYLSGQANAHYSRPTHPHASHASPSIYPPPVPSLGGMRGQPSRSTFQTHKGHHVSHHINGDVSKFSSPSPSSSLPPSPALSSSSSTSTEQDMQGPALNMVAPSTPYNSGAYGMIPNMSLPPHQMAHPSANSMAPGYSIYGNPYANVNPYGVKPPPSSSSSSSRSTTTTITTPTPRVWAASPPPTAPPPIQPPTKLPRIHLITPLHPRRTARSAARRGQMLISSKLSCERKLASTRLTHPDRYRL